MIWIRIGISGRPPIPRFGHSLSISGSNLILFGGWTNISGIRGKKENMKTNNPYLMALNTKSFSWEDVVFFGELPPNRYGHSCTTIGSHLLIFGGWEHNRATNEVVILRDINSLHSSEHTSENQ